MYGYCFFIFFLILVGTVGTVTYGTVSSSFLSCSWKKPVDVRVNTKNLESIVVFFFFNSIFSTVHNERESIYFFSQTFCHVQVNSYCSTGTQIDTLETTVSLRSRFYINMSPLEYQYRPVQYTVEIVNFVSINVSFFMFLFGSS